MKSSTSKNILGRCVYVLHLLSGLLPIGSLAGPGGGQTKSLPPNQTANSTPLTGVEALQHLKNTAQFESLSAAITEARYTAKADGQDKAFAQNSAHRIQSSFTPEGLRLEVRAGEALHKVAWRLGSLGYGTSQIVVPSGQLSMLGQRIEVRRESLNLTEWFHNTPDGLEHGFTLNKRPATNPGGEPLRLVIGVTGDLAPHAEAAGQSLSLRDLAGHTVLSYAKLKVWDATGAVLPATMQVSTADGQVTLTVEENSASYPLTIDPTFTQQTYLKASNPGGADPDRDFENGDTFGNSVAVSGDTVVIGAEGEDSNATGINGDQANNDAFGAGAVYIFVRSGATWVQQAYLKASNSEDSDHFGAAVAISGDTVIVGAFGEDSTAIGVNGDQSNNSTTVSGAAYVFVRNGTTWTQQAYLKASNTGQTDFFGVSVAISGNTAVVGAHREDSNAKAINGNGGNNSAEDAGAAYVFARDGTAWTQQAYLKGSNTTAGDLFGLSVSISGDTVVVGSRGDDSSAMGINGSSNDLDGDDVIDKSINSGAAFVFVRSGTIWSQQAFLKPGLPPFDPFSTFTESASFGTSVSVSVNTVVVGSPGEFGQRGSGIAHVFIRIGTTWEHQTHLVKESEDPFDELGRFVVVSDDTIALTGAEIFGPQLVKVYQRSGTNWSGIGKFKSSIQDSVDEFSRSIGLSGDILVAGAPLEQSNAAGVDGDATNNSLNEAGAAYIFVLPLTPIASPEIAVEQPSGTNLVDGGNRTFGNVNVGATTNLTFTVKNSGTADLTGLGITIDGTDSAQFTVTANPTAPVAGPAGSTTFTLMFAPTNAGTKTASLHISSNDSDENPFLINLVGEGAGAANSSPALTLPASPVIVEATSAAGAVVTFAVSAADSEDGALTPIVTPSSGSSFALGETTVNVSATDSANATTTGSFVVRVVDTTAPVLTLPTSPLATTTASPTGTVVTFVVGANDLVTGSVSATANPPSGSIFAIGETIVNVSATDSAGNVATNSFMVQVIGVPEIVVEQPENTNLSDGGSRDFGPATVGSTSSLTFTIKNTGPANLSGLEITIDGTDAAQFTVTTSLTAPVAGPAGSTTFTVHFAPTSVGAKTAALHLSSNDSDENPFDLTLTGMGTAVGNSPPRLTLPVSPIIIEATSSNGAPVSFAVTANDPEDGFLTPIVAPASGSTFALGDTTVNVSVTDSANATITGSFIVRVRDTTPPVLTLPASPLTGVATSPSGGAVTFTVTASDLVNRWVATTANPPSGSTFPIGDTTVNVSATDVAGNMSSNSFVVRITDQPDTESLGPITIVRLVDGIQLTLHVTTTRLVGIEYSETMNPVSWVDIGNVTIVEGLGNFTDSDPTRVEKPQGFYRAFLR